MEEREVVGDVSNQVRKSSQSSKAAKLVWASVAHRVEAQRLSFLVLNMLVLINIFSASSHCLQRGGCLPWAWAESGAAALGGGSESGSNKGPFHSQMFIGDQLVQGSTGAWFSLELPALLLGHLRPPQSRLTGQGGTQSKNLEIINRTLTVNMPQHIESAPGL